MQCPSLAELQRITDRLGACKLCQRSLHLPTYTLWRLPRAPELAVELGSRDKSGPGTTLHTVQQTYFAKLAEHFGSARIARYLSDKHPAQKPVQEGDLAA